MRARTSPFLVALAATALAACSGGGGGTSSPAPSPPIAAAGLVSGPSPFAAGCGGTNGTLYVNAEVEPSLAVNPANPSHLLAMWHQIGRRAAERAVQRLGARPGLGGFVRRRRHLDAAGDGLLALRGRHGGQWRRL